MSDNKKFLQPVKREDFNLIKNTTVVSDDFVSPEYYFPHVILQIKKFAIGPYFWFIANLTNGKVAVAEGMIEEITSIDKKSFIQGSPDQLFHRTHPDDIQQMFAFSNYWLALLIKLPPEKRSYLNPTIYIRIKNQDELYHWVMVQYIDHIFDEKDEILFAFTLVTDISFIKKDGPAMMSILDTSDETCQHFYCVDGKSPERISQSFPTITLRELEVLGYLAIGYSSKQIAAEMNIAGNTVDNHRQSMLRKTNSKSTGELVNFAIKAGFV